MLSLKQKIESVMHSENGIATGPLAPLLYGISGVYGVVQKLRAFGYRQQLFRSRALPCRVISIGNITAGGTGKTPMTIYLAQQLQQLGTRVVVISRGYKGGAEKGGGIVSDGINRIMDSEQAGDEPFLMASRLKDIPVLVGKNRFEAGLLAILHFQPEVIVLDDGFQHLKLARDIDIVLLDHARPLGNLHLLPRGILRESPEALTRASACILTRCPSPTDQTVSDNHAGVQTFAPQIPVFRSFHDPYFYMVRGGARTPLHPISDFLLPRELDAIRQRKLFGFSGIARNDDFQRTVAEAGFESVGYSEFDDHHRYRRRDLADIAQAAQQAGADCLITTEKDHARIAYQMPLSMDLVVVGVRIGFCCGDGDKFISFIQRFLQL
jgi:tetraacyldisaccharide 4'-kinase